MDFINSKIVEEVCLFADNVYKLGWHERNAGNLSIRIDNTEAEKYNTSVQRKINVDFDTKEIIGQYYLVTGSGKYFKNISKNPEDCLGLIKINNGYVDLLWGFNDGETKPTSELSGHLLSHLTKQKIDTNYSVIFHSHATYTTAMTFVHKLDEKSFTKTLWQTESECIIVFPEGIGLIPWGVPGTNIIGIQTAEKMKKYSIVIWPCHGIFCAGKSLDDAFGLMECVEKSAKMWFLANSVLPGGAVTGKIKNNITDDMLKEIVKVYKLKPNKDFL